MQRHFLVQRTDANDWYNKAKEFLAENKCYPLAVEVSSDVDPATIFQQALASLTATAGQELEIDTAAQVVLVTADLSNTKPSLERACMCKCGPAATCCGSGSGHTIE
jgi:hypothetical protein